MIDPKNPIPSVSPASVTIKAMRINSQDVYDLRVPYCIQTMSEDAVHQLYDELGRLGTLLGWEKR